MNELTDEMILGSTIRSIGTPNFISELLEYMRDVATFRGVLIAILSEGSAPEHVYDNVREERRSVVVDRWLDRAWSLDPYVTAFLENRHNNVMTIKQVAPDRFRKSEYYDTYYRSIRLRDELAVYVELGGGTMFISLGRLVGESKFSAKDVDRLNQAHPIIAALCQQHFRNRAARIGPSVDRDDVMRRLGGGLTQRELDVVSFILRGHSSKSIARRLDLSVETIKVHRKNTYRKLGISSQSALFALFLQAN